MAFDSRQMIKMVTRSPTVTTVRLNPSGCHFLYPLCMLNKLVRETFSHIIHLFHLKADFLNTCQSLPVTLSVAHI